MLIFALILLNICRCWSQTGTFQLGFLDNDIFNYIKPFVLSGSKLQIQVISIPTDLNINSGSFSTTQSTLNSYHAIIGRFNYAVATICQTLSLAYFVIDEQIDRSANTGALLDFSLDIRLLGGALSYTLTKYNWIQNLQFISDSSSNAMDILWSLAGQTIKQCNFQPTDNGSTIANCYQNQNFVFTPGKAYVVVTDDANTVLLGNIMQQFIYRSLPYNSFIFFPMMNTNSILVQYHYAGGVLYAFKQTINDSETQYTILNTNAYQSLIQINNTINSNSFLNFNNHSATLQYLQQQNLIFKPTGDQLTYTFYWTVLNNMTSNVATLVSPVNYIFTYSFPKSIPDPTNLAVTDVIDTIYIPDQVMATNIANADGSVTPTGFMIEFLNSLLLPIKLSYTTSQVQGINNIGRLTTTGYTGMLSLMFNNQTQMIAFPVPFVDAYLKRFIYSQRIFTVPYSILMFKSQKGLNLSRLADPYSPIVWIIILISIVFLSIILWLINFISPNIADSSEKLTINNSIFMVIGSFLMAKMLVKPNMISTQIFYLLIWLVTLLFIASYVANLSVSIAFQKAQLIQFTTMQQLLDQKNMNWAFLQDSILYDMIMIDIDNNVDSVIVQMYLYAQRTWPDKYLLNNSIDIPSFLGNNTNFGLLNDAYHNFYYSLRNCSLITVNDPTKNLSLAYIMQPGFKYRTQLYQQIILMQTTGTIDYLANKYFLVGQCSTINPLISGIQPLDLNDMAGIFVLIGIGILAAFPTGVIEYLLNKSKLQCQRKIRGNSLKFGQIYKAKVTALDRNGVTVDIGRLNLFSSDNEGRVYYVPKKYLGVKRKGEREILAPTDQGIMIGTKLLLKYMGNNPVDSKRIFMQVHKK